MELAMSQFEERSEDEFKTAPLPGRSNTTGSVRFPRGHIVSDRYKIEGVLGEGGFGIVYRVTQIFLNKEMALKVLNRSQASDVHYLRFQQEAKAAAALNHPAIIKVIDFGLLEGDVPFLAMELVDGITLSDYLEQHGALELEAAIPLFMRICDGLGFAHRHGIIHRDIKPSNIMLLEQENYLQGDIKIVDFGIAKLSHTENGEIQSLTHTGEIFGSPLYMSPEQCDGKPVDSRSDVYSLGCVFFQSLTGSVPFVGNNSLATMLMHSKQPPPTLSEIAQKEIPERLESIVAKMLAKSPTERFENLGEVISELQKVLEILGVEDTFVPQAVKDDNKRKSALLAVSAILVSIAIGLFTYNLLPKHTTSTVKLPTSAETESFKSITQQMDVGEEEGFYTKEYKTIDGRMMRKYHVPFAFAKFAAFDENGFQFKKIGTMISSDFELPVECSLYITVREQTKVTPETFKHVDPNAVRSLILSNCDNITEDVIAQVGRLTGIRTLILTRTGIGDECIVHLNKLPHLHELKIEENKITIGGLKKLTRLKDLTTLNVSSLEGANTLLSELSKNMFMLGLRNCNIADSDMSKIAGFKILQVLNIRENPNVTNTGIKKLLQCKLLRDLDIADTNVTPQGVRALANLPKFDSLRVGKLPDAKVLEFSRALPHVKIHADNKMEMVDGKYAVQETPDAAGWLHMN